MLGNTLLRGYGVTISQESNPIPPASPQKSPWTFLRAFATARSLLHCHASPVRNGWLPYDSGHKQAAYAVLGLYPSLRSIQPAHDGSVASLLPRRVSPPQAEKSNPISCFPGTCASENTLLRGNGVTIPQESNPIPPASPHKSPWTFVRAFATARSLLHCHASPVRNGWLPYDSGHKQAAYAVLGLYPSLRSIQPAHDGSVAQLPTTTRISTTAKSTWQAPTLTP